MSLIKRNPSKEMELWNSGFPVARSLERFQRDMNRMFDEFFRGDLFDTDWTRSISWNPAVDISESNDSYNIKAELPGLKNEDVKITLNNNVITIRGEKKSDGEKKGSNFHRIERQYGSFERSFILPGTVSSDKIEALFNDGILTVTLPKTEETKEKVVDIKIK